MAISFIGQAAAVATSVTLPAHQAGDLIAIFAYRNATTAPSLPAGFTSIATQSANSNSFRVGYKFAASSSETSGTWTNASQVEAVVYRGVWAVGGASSSTAATTTAQTITGIATMQTTDGTSWAVSFQGSHQTTSTSTPSGTTLRGTVNTDATSGTSVGIWDSNGGVSSWAAHTNTLGTTSVAASGSFELVDAGPLVQWKQQIRTSPASTQTATWNGNTTTGNLIVVQVVNDSASANTVTGVTDSQSNTYTKAFSVTSSSTGTVDLWYAYNITGGTTPTVTITQDSTYEAGILLMEFSGFGATDPLDKKATSGSGFSSTPSAGPTAATTQASELVIGSASTNSGTNTYTGSFARVARTTTIASDVDMGTEYKTVSSTGTQTASFTISSSSNWGAGVATFKINSGSVITTTQAATARISNNLTKTQGALARIQTNRTLAQPATARIARNLTKTQPAVSRIQVNLTKTQPATARVATNPTKAQPALARIATSVTKTQPAKARIQQTVTSAQPAKARIAQSFTKTQSALARVQINRSTTQPAISRIQVTVTATQPATARVATNLTKTQSATARISNIVTRTATQSATARIQVGLVRTQPAQARIQQNLTITQTATARTSITGVKTQSAISRIQTNPIKTQPATARVKMVVTFTQPAIARIQTNQSITQAAISRIEENLTKAQPATARVSVRRTATQSATARIAVSGYVDLPSTPLYYDIGGGLSIPLQPFGQIAFSNGAPTKAQNGYVICFDYLNNNLYVYNVFTSSWVKVAMA